MNGVTTYYISGPMRGYEEYNFPAFLACEEYIDSCYVSWSTRIFNPARKDIEEGIDPTEELEITEDLMHQWMRRDLTDVAASDVIVLLPGFERSEGARRELSVAKWCGLMPALYDPEAETGFRLEWPTWEYLAEVCLAADNEEALDELVDQEFEDIIEASTDAIEFLTWEELDELEALRPEQQQPMPGTLRDAYLAAKGGEIRVTNDLTGGAKGSKPERYDLVPVGPLAELARLYGYGAGKYADRNWEKGYDWNLSYAALQRHANAFWSGTDIDPESGCHHLASVVFHAFAMIEWGTTHPELDNRP